MPFVLLLGAVGTGILVSESLSDSLSCSCSCSLSTSVIVLSGKGWAILDMSETSSGAASSSLLSSSPVMCSGEGRLSMGVDYPWTGEQEHPSSYCSHMAGPSRPPSCSFRISDASPSLSESGLFSSPVTLSCPILPCRGSNRFLCRTPGLPPTILFTT